ncbi:FeoA domain protein [Planctopirus ephydatiae]|uniref:FeoA domain protein n=1 Tax=Planctopirus ephydatiae TaxID=2528019 RepID=A0A518GSE6_9PLAN|nr:FeoA domain protein [Planctopirus ephydatiae]
MSYTIPLDCLKAGESAQVVDIDGDTTLLTRLQEIGLNVGSQVRMVLPGSPCIISLAGNQFSLRTDDLATVLVEPSVTQ